MFVKLLILKLRNVNSAWLRRILNEFYLFLFFEFLWYTYKIEVTENSHSPRWGTSRTSEFCQKYSFYVTPFRRLVTHNGSFYWDCFTVSISVILHCKLLLFFKLTVLVFWLLINIVLVPKRRLTLSCIFLSSLFFFRFCGVSYSRGRGLVGVDTWIVF